MRTRILTGVVAFLIFLPFLIFSDTIAFPIAMTICAVVSVFEMLRCVKLHKNLAITIPLLLIAAATPLALRLWGIENTLTAALATVVGILNLLFAQYRARANDLRACRCAGMTRADIRRLLFTEILLLFLAALLLAIPATIGFCRILDVTVNAFGADFF